MNFFEFLEFLVEKIVSLVIIVVLLGVAAFTLLVTVTFFGMHNYVFGIIFGLLSICLLAEFLLFARDLV